MSDVKVRAIKAFDLFDGSGLRSEGDEFTVDGGTAAELGALGLAKTVDDDEPKPKRRGRVNVEDE